MRRLRGALLVAFALALLVPVGTNAFAFSDTYYVGHTSPGKDLLFVVHHDSSGDTFDPNYIKFRVTCKDGLEFTSQWSFSGFRIPLDSEGRFDLDLPFYPFEHFRWRGQITDTDARGRGLDVIGAITVDDQGQTCGTLTQWKARALNPSARSSADAPDVVVNVTRNADGSVSRTMRSFGG